MLSHTYIDRGTDTTIVLLHGVVGDRSQLRTLHDLPYSILAPDLPGHGENTKFEPDPPLQGTTDALKALLAEHDITRYYLIGYSLGGYLALDMLGRGITPEKLVLISTGYTLPYYEQLKKHDIIERALPLVKSSEQLLQKFIDAYRDHRGVMEHSVKGRFDIDTGVALLKAIADQDLKPHCQDYDKPALIIHGTRDFIIPKSIGEATAKALPQADIKLLKTDHSHIVIHDKLRKIVGEFLSSDQ